MFNPMLNPNVDIYTQIKQFILDSEKVLITSHFSPDGDAIGSVTTMSGIVEQLGVKHRIIIDDPVPVRYKFIPGSEKIDLAVDEVDTTYDRVIVLDAGAMNRIGKVKNYISPDAKVLNIDHHVTAFDFGDVKHVDTEVSATCEMLYDLSLKLNLEITKSMAYAIFVGILTDTGRFRFSNTTHRAYEICADLMHLGVNGNWVNETLFFNVPLHVVKTSGYVMSNIEMFFDDMFVLMFLPKEMHPSVSEGLVEQGTAIKGVGICALLTEYDVNKFKVSLRSRCRIDVCAIAAEFKGGGHVKAAGFRFEGELSELREAVLNAFERQIKAINLQPSELMYNAIPNSTVEH